MPSYPPNQALQSHLDAQIGTLADYTRKSVETACRLADLHFTLTRDLWDDYLNLARQMAGATDPAALAALLSRQAEPFGARLRSYAQGLGSVLGGIQGNLTRATESLLPEATRAAQLFAASAMPGASGANGAARPGGNGAA